MRALHAAVIVTAVLVLWPVFYNLIAYRVF